MKDSGWTLSYVEHRTIRNEPRRSLERHQNGMSCEQCMAVGFGRKEATRRVLVRWCEMKFGSWALRSELHENGQLREH